MRPALLLQLFPHESTNERLQRDLLANDERPQCVVDECLIVATTGFVDPCAEPVEDIVVKSDGDAAPRATLRSNGQASRSRGPRLRA
jgi:hypothetical protein